MKACSAPLSCGVGIWYFECLLAAQGSNPTPEAQWAVEAAQMAVAAQKQAIETNEPNRQRTMLSFDDEGRLLEKLWAGEQP